MMGGARTITGNSSSCRNESHPMRRSHRKNRPLGESTPARKKHERRPPLSRRLRFEFVEMRHRQFHRQGIPDRYIPGGVVILRLQGGNP
jgi:hypothetical protein